MEKTITTTKQGSVVYRLNENIIATKEHDGVNISLRNGDILSHETLNSLIELGYYEISVTILVLQ